MLVAGESAAVVDLGGTGVVCGGEGNARHASRAIGRRVAVFDAGVPDAAVVPGCAIVVGGTSRARDSTARLHDAVAGPWEDVH
jgi:hypothetical protein